MRGIEIVKLVVLIVFSLNTILLAGLLVLKTVHRRGNTSGQKRRADYMALLSRHIAFDDCTDLITPAMAQDPAFLDALIDVRNALVGPEVQTLRGIVDRYGIVIRQTGRLKSRIPAGRRLRAAVALAELGDQSSAPLLMEHLADRDPEIRIQCARGLGRIRWIPAIEAIVGRFSEETPWVRSRFADTLVGFGGEATGPLMSYIQAHHLNEDAGPALAIRTLAVIGDDSATLPLLSILDEAIRPEVLLAVIESLGVLANPLALPKLLLRAGHDDWRVRAKTATALGLIGEPSALPELIKGLTDSAWWVRRNSAAALVHIPGGIDRLHTALQHADSFASDAASEALADAGELVAARARAEAGEAQERDLVLIGYMEGTEET